jgi:putative ABC transport system substrate-binding protein
MAGIVNVGRREFITLLGGAAGAWPWAARAQQAAMPVIGFLSLRSPRDSTHLIDGFRAGLKENGYVEGNNVGIEFRFAEGRYDRLPAMATDLVSRHVAVIAAPDGAAPALAAKAATSTIPIAFLVAADPVKVGLVASLNRPGGNLTGVTTLNVKVGPKRLELLLEVVPTARVIGALVNPINSANTETTLRELQSAAGILGVQIHVLHASRESDFAVAFASLDQVRAGGLLIGTDGFLISRSEQLADLALRHGLPAIFQYREFAAAGGLMSYGSRFEDSYRLVGVYTGRMLKGEKPADLPVQQSTKVELIVNLKTAKALGLEVPPTLLARADEVIE